MTGTNTKTTDTGLTNAAAIINQQRIIVQDCFAYINNVNCFSRDLVPLEMISAYSAMIRDLEYPETTAHL